MAKKLKLQNDSWAFVSPGGFVAYETVTSTVLEAIAAIAGRGDGKAIYDHFLKHLQNQREGTYRPLADYVYASRAAANVVAAAAKQNGALFVRSFVYACDRLRERGVAVPPREWTLMIWAENSSGYGIKNGTIVKFATQLDVMQGQITVRGDVQEPVA